MTAYPNLVSLRIRYVLAILPLLTLIPEALADIGAVSTVPSKANVMTSRSTVITVTWIVEEDAGPDTVSSSQGQFIANNQVLATVNTVLSQSTPVHLGLRVTFSENVVVPSAVVLQALRLGASNIQYQRTFSDSGGSNSGFITLAPTGSGGAGFQVSRIELKFDDNARVRVVPHQTQLTAIAEINFSGSGRLRAEWLVRDPTNIAGARLRTLAVVYRNLAGGRRIRLVSPRLPTSMQGPYQLEFRVIEPAMVRSAPRLDYYVTASASNIPLAINPMKVTGPKGGSRLQADTLIGWESVRGTQIYVVEVYLAESSLLRSDSGSTIRLADLPASSFSDPITGKIVLGETTETVLEGISTAHLIPNRLYWWSVKAIDPGGNIINQSRLHEFRYSP